MYNTVDELWKRIHRFCFIAKKLLCLLVNVSLPNRFSGASERAQKHPGDAPYHVTSLPKDVKKTAGEINSLLNCHDTWPYTGLLHLFFRLLLFYFFICRLIHTFCKWKRKNWDCSNLRIKENNHMKMLLWFRIDFHTSKDRKQSSSALEGYFSVNHCVLLYNAALSSILTESGQRAHLSLLVGVVSYCK